MEQQTEFRTSCTTSLAATGKREGGRGTLRCSFYPWRLPGSDYGALDRCWPDINSSTFCSSPRLRFALHTCKGWTACETIAWKQAKNRGVEGCICQWAVLCIHHMSECSLHLNNNSTSIVMHQSKVPSLCTKCAYPHSVEGAFKHSCHRYNRGGESSRLFQDSSSNQGPPGESLGIRKFPQCYCWFIFQAQQKSTCGV